MIETSGQTGVRGSMSIVCLVPLLLVVALNLSGEEKSKYSKRFDKLMITVTEIETPVAVLTMGEEGKRLEPRGDYRFLLVRVKLRNVHKKRGVREWLNLVLRTTVGLEYGPSVRLMGPGPYQREIYELLPGEETQGVYVFEVKEGAAPDRITFKRAFDTRHVSISLKGFPVQGMQQ